MSAFGWFDGEIGIQSWFDAELNDSGWFDTEAISPPTKSGNYVKVSSTGSGTAPPLVFGGAVEPLLFYVDGETGTVAKDVSGRGGTERAANITTVTSAVAKYGTKAINCTTGTAFQNRAELIVNGGTPWGNSNYTLEFWSYVPAVYVAGGSCISIKTPTYIHAGVDYSVNAPGTLAQYTISVDADGIVGGGDLGSVIFPNLPTATWNHFAVVKRGNEYYAYANGVGSAAPFLTSANTISTYADVILKEHSGQLDDIAITPYAKYTGDFTPAPIFNPFPTFSGTTQVASGTVGAAGPRVGAGANTTACTGTGTGYADPRLDADFASVVSLLHCDQASLVGCDVKSANVWSQVAGGFVSLGTAYFGAGAYTFNTNRAIYTPASTALDVGTGEFTAELWVRTPSFTNNETIVSSYDSAAATGFRIAIRSDGGFQINMFSSDGGSFAASATGAYTTNTWYHLALVKSGTTATLYKNGVAVITATNTVFAANTAKDLVIGATIDQVTRALSSQFLGSIDEFRLSKGLARYTASFTPEVRAWGNLSSLTATNDSYTTQTSSGVGQVKVSGTGANAFAVSGAGSGSVAVIGVIGAGSTTLVNATATGTGVAKIRSTTGYLDPFYDKVAAQVNGDVGNAYVLYDGQTSGNLVNTVTLDQSLAPWLKWASAIGPPVADNNSTETGGYLFTMSMVGPAGGLINAMKGDDYSGSYAPPYIRFAGATHNTSRTVLPLGHAGRRAFPAIGTVDGLLDGSTLEMWMYVPSGVTLEGWDAIHIRNEGRGNFPTLAVPMLSDGTATVYMRRRDTLASLDVSVTSTAFSYPKDAWFHFAISSAFDRVRVFIGGAQVTSFDFHYGPFDSSDGDQYYGHRMELIGGLAATTATAPQRAQLATVACTDFRFTRTGRYVSNFAPSTTKLLSAPAPVTGLLRTQVGVEIVSMSSAGVGNTGFSGITGSGASTLAAFTGTGAVGVRATGTGTATTATLTSSGTGGVRVTGTSTKTLTAFTGTGAGSFPAIGTGTALVTFTSAGTALTSFSNISGIGTGTTLVASAATGAVKVTGTGSNTTATTSAGAGAVAFVPRTGAGSNTATIASTGTGTVKVSGAGSSATSATSAGAGKAFVSGLGAITVTQISTATGTVLILAVGSNTFNLTALADGTVADPPTPDPRRTLGVAPELRGYVVAPELRVLSIGPTQSAAAGANIIRLDVAADLRRTIITADPRTLSAGTDTRKLETSS